MIDPDLTKKFFLESDSDQLKRVYQWARARYAAPWAVFGAVLARVAATTEPTVQLPGIIGGRASLNLMCAFVSASGGGKGISDKVAREAWPADIVERPIGSGEGIAETFRPPAKETEDAERITRAIITVPEIDTLVGLADKQGSILLATLKSAAMGELIGQANASKATTRIVQAHTYRVCMSVGVQYGHGAVIFNDSTGGTPQRFLWFPTNDPDMPAEAPADPEPLNAELPQWAKNATGTTEITYGHPGIRQTVIAAHLARQRGDAEALDGHALLTRCKVAATIAIMHHRSVVCEKDWELSAMVMAVSDDTRQMLLDHAKQAARAKIRERAISRAVGEDFYDASRLETVKRSIMRMLERDGEQAGGDLRRRLGKREKRELFDQAISLLEADGHVAMRPGEHSSVRYRIGSPVTNEVTPEKASSEGVTRQVTRDHPATVTDLDSRRSHDSERPKVSCRVWFDEYASHAICDGHQRLNPLAVIADGAAAGYKEQSVRAAASAHPGVNAIWVDGTTAWSLIGEVQPTAPEVIAAYLDQLPANTKVVDQTDFYAYAERHGVTRATARKVIVRSGRVDSVPARGNAKAERTWHIVPADPEEGEAS